MQNRIRNHGSVVGELVDPETESLDILSRPGVLRGHAVAIAHEVELPVADLVINPALGCISGLDVRQCDLEGRDVEHPVQKRWGQIELHLRLWRPVARDTVYQETSFHLLGGKCLDVWRRTPRFEMAGHIIAVDALVTIIIPAIITDLPAIKTNRCAPTV